MKKTLTVVLLLSLSVSAFSQGKKKRPDSIKRYSSSIVVGANAAIRNSWVFNKNLKKWGEDSKRQPGFGSMFGVQALYYINNNIAVGINPSFGSLKQSYTGQDTIFGSNTGQVVTYESNTIFKTIDLPLYAKYVTEGGAYFELGFNYGMVTSAKFTSIAGTSALFKADKVETTSMWSSAYYAPMIGFGFDMYLTDDLLFEGFLRTAYGINNMKGHDGRAYEGSTNAFGPFKLYDNPNYDSSVKTQFFWVGVGIGLIYRFDL